MGSRSWPWWREREARWQTWLGGVICYVQWTHSTLKWWTRGRSLTPSWKAPRLKITFVLFPAVLPDTFRALGPGLASQCIAAYTWDSSSPVWHVLYIFGAADVSFSLPHVSQGLGSRSRDAKSHCGTPCLKGRLPREPPSSWGAPSIESPSPWCCFWPWFLSDCNNLFCDEWTIWKKIF